MWLIYNQVKQAKEKKKESNKKANYILDSFTKT